MAFTQIVSLDQMRQTTRRMTARYDEAQMPTSQIDYYINLAYTLRLPEQFKNIKLTKPYTFLTTPNVDTYPFPYEPGLLDDPTQPVGNRDVPGNIQITPPVYCQGYILRYYQDKNTFYNRWPNLSVNQQINSGSGLADFQYSGIIPSTPFYRAQVDVFGNVTEPMVIISAIVPNVQSANSGFSYTLTDQPKPSPTNINIADLVDINGNIVGEVNYLTGAYEFTVANSEIIPSDATIFAAVVPYQASRPVDVLFYNQQFVFRPCPLQVYQVEFQVSQMPTQLIAAGDAPELDEWWLFICAMAAELIYIDFPDPEGMAYLKPTLDEQRCEAQRRTLKQLGTQRAQTIFSTPGRFGAGYFYGNQYSGGGAP